MEDMCVIPKEYMCAFVKTEKGGNEMTKQLYHVILFNKVTETIDYKAYLPAQDQTDAVMIAAQNHGKYNSNIHIVITKHIAEYDKKG